MRRYRHRGGLAIAGSKSKIGDEYWRLRVFVGKSESGSSRFVSKNFRGGVRAADKALAKLVVDVHSGKIRSGTETVSDLLDRSSITARQAANLPPL